MSTKRASEDSYVCTYCFKLYVEDRNVKGSCIEAPDPTEKIIDLISCMCCAKLCWYFVTVDDDGDYEDPWITARKSPDWRQRIKWYLLSLVLPCLCCYGPLVKIQNTARRHSLCGGKHEPVSI